MTNESQTNNLQSISKEKDKIDALILEAIQLGFTSLRLEIADGKIVSGGLEKKLKFR